MIELRQLRNDVINPLNLYLSKSRPREKLLKGTRIYHPKKTFLADVYFELKSIENKQKQKKRYKQGTGFPFLKEIYIYKENLICKDVLCSHNRRRRTLNNLSMEKKPLWSA